MKLNEGIKGYNYRIKKINIEDDDLNRYLFSLGCYEGEEIKILHNQKRNIIIFMKQSRYSFDNKLADKIEIELF